MTLRRIVWPALLPVLLFAVTCSQRPTVAPSAVSSGIADASASQGGTGSNAVIDFGQTDVGSPFPPPAFDHDQSSHARDNLVPRTVTIDRGGTVTFKTFGIHQVAIYRAGTEPEDINTSLLVPSPCLPAFFPPLKINDPNGRITIWNPPCAGGPTAPTWTFNTPGKYLVICAFLPHFNVQMYGWVIVRD